MPKDLEGGIKIACRGRRVGGEKIAGKMNTESRSQKPE
jgi:hypothetical protein